MDLPIVCNHRRQNVGPSDEDHHAAGTRHGGIEQVAALQHRSAAVERHDNDGILASLTLMDGDRVGMLELLELRRVINDLAPVEIDRQLLGRRIDARDAADISVKDADARDAALFPFELVVVLSCMTLSPSQKTVSRKRICFLRLVRGFIVADSRRFRLSVPERPRREGVMTWVSPRIASP